MSEREKLAEHLWARVRSNPTYKWSGVPDNRKEEMRIHADFVIDDRKRVLGDIRIARLNYAHKKEIMPLIRAIDRTFTNEGVEL